MPYTCSLLVYLLSPVSCLLPTTQTLTAVCQKRLPTRKAVGRGLCSQPPTDSVPYYWGRIHESRACRSVILNVGNMTIATRLRVSDVAIHLTVGTASYFALNHVPLNRAKHHLRFAVRLKGQT